MIHDLRPLKAHLRSQCSGPCLAVLKIQNLPQIVCLDLMNPGSCHTGLLQTDPANLSLLQKSNLGRKCVMEPMVFAFLCGVAKEKYSRVDL